MRNIVVNAAAAFSMPQPLPAIVAAEDQQCGHVPEPRLPDGTLGQSAEDLPLQRGIIHDDYVALLQVTLTGRGQGEGTKDFDQLGRHLAVGEGAAAAAGRWVHPAARYRRGAPCAARRAVSSMRRK